MKKVVSISLLAFVLFILPSCNQSSSPRQTQPIDTDRLQATGTPAPDLPGITWTSIGPGGGGNLTSIAFAPSGTIYVSCDVGGVYRSSDDAHTWEIVNAGLRNYAIIEIAVDPVDSSLIYLGSYDGVYKSDDGGDHWEWMSKGFSKVNEWPWGVPIGSLAIDPNNPAIIYAGVGDTDFDRWGQGTIYKSTDYGESWFVVTEDSQNIDPEAIIYDMAINPQDSNTLYASTDRGFYKSLDAGVTWERKETGLPHDRTREVAIYPLNPDILYLTLFSAPSEDPWQGGVYKSMDGGETWTAKINGFDVIVGDPGMSAYSTANYEQIEVDFQNPDVVYVGANYWTGKFGVYRTTNGGDHWQLVTREDNWERGWRPQEGTQRVESMAMDPANPTRLIWGETGLFQTLDGGDTWHQIYTNEIPSGSYAWQGRGLEVTGVYDIEVDPTKPDIVYFAYGDISFFRSEDSGQTFTRSIGGLDLSTVNSFFRIAIDPEDTSILYAGRGRWYWNTGEVVKSVDGGRNWITIGNPDNGLPDARVFDLVLDYSSPVESRTIYVASYEEGIYKSIDGGNNWVAINEGIDASEGYCTRSIAIDPSNPMVLYAGFDQGGGLYKTEDGGMNWLEVPENIHEITDIVIDPQDPQTLYIGTLGYWNDVEQVEKEGGVYRTRDGGDTWELVFSNPVPDKFLFVRELAIDPTNSEIIYVGTKDSDDNPLGFGVYRSMDGGKNWQPVNSGLSHLSIFSIQIDPTNPNILYLGTEGNGVFKGLVE